MTRLVVESVSSSSQLRRALSPGQAESYGEYDGETLVVGDEHDADALVNRYPNVHYPSDETPQNDAEAVRMEADNDGVEYKCGVNGCSREVDGPDDQCWQHESDE